MWLTRLALRNPVLILMMSLMTLALGWVALTRLPVDLFPDIDIPQIRWPPSTRAPVRRDVEKSITVPIERAVSAAPGRRPGGEHLAAGLLGGHGLVPVRRQPRQRPVRGPAAGGADPEHAAPGDRPALHRQVRRLQHPGGLRLDERRGARRAGALRPRLQRGGAPARAHQGRGQRPHRRRQGPRDPGAPRERRAALPRPHRARRGEHRPRLQPAPPQRHAAGRGPGLQRLLQHPDRVGPAAARRGGPARRTRGRQRPGGAGAHLRRGPGRRRHRRPDRDRAGERSARRLLPGPEAARRQHRGRGRPAPQDPSRACAASPPT